MNFEVGFSDPVWCAKMGIEPTEHYSEIKDEATRRKLAIDWQAESFSGVFRTWKVSSSRKFTFFFVLAFS